LMAARQSSQTEGMSEPHQSTQRRRPSLGCLSVVAAISVLTAICSSFVWDVYRRAAELERFIELGGYCDTVPSDTGWVHDTLRAFEYDWLAMSFSEAHWTSPRMVGAQE